MILLVMILILMLGVILLVNDFSKNIMIVRGRALMLSQGEYTPLSNIKLVFQHNDTHTFYSTFTNNNGGFKIPTMRGYGSYSVTIPYLDNRVIEVPILDDYWEIIVERDEEGY